MKYNLYSVSQLMDDGWKMTGDTKGIVMVKKGNKMVFLDLSSVRPQVGVAALHKSNWRILVDECTNFKISHFFHRKYQMAEAMCKLLKGWKDKGIVTKFVRMDNAGDNKLFEQRARGKDWQLGIQMEYTPRDMPQHNPQHNRLAELAFAAIRSKGRAMLVQANVPLKYCFHLYREAFKMATDLDGLVMVTMNGKRATRYQHMFGSNPRWTKHLRLFGEAGTVKTTTGTTAKLADRGVQCMMVGYAENHDGDVYRM